MIRLDRVEAMVVGCILALGPAGTTAVWARSLYPHRSSASAVVTGAIVRGPMLRPIEVKTIDAPTAVRWSLADVVAGRRVGLDMTGARWAVDVTAGQTVTQVRDALLALFAGTAGVEYLPGVEITANGIDAIDFDADGVPGLLYNPARIGASVVAATSTVEAEVGLSVGMLMVELQAYAAGGGSDALGVLGAINGGMSMDRAVSLRSALGVSYHGAQEPADLTSLAGAQWESRAMTRWQLSTRSYVAHPIAVIETAEMGLTVYDGDTPIEIETEITDPGA